MLSPRLWPEAAVTVARTFGARGACLRAVHEARRGTGWFLAAPRWEAEEGVPHPHPFAVDRGALREVTDPEAARERAERVAAGWHEAYRWEWRRLPEGPEGWLVHPVTGRRRSADMLWWRVPHLDPGFGDIKELWEPGRFAWAYDLVRGWLATGEERYAEALHARVAEWEEGNPAYRGPHWSCGQEAAIRAVALLYAEANLADARASTPEAMGRLTRVLAASGERIADALGYAVSQRNNHGISEAAGLVALGVRFRGRHPEAEKWLETGSALLDRLVIEQFAEDGWYIQHSFTYLRLALDQLVVAERALQTVERGLAPVTGERIRAAAGLLFAVLDPESGEVPVHGANDGAFVHPITLARYRDFRPVLTAVCATWGVPLPRSVAVDREVLAWLGLGAPPVGEALGEGVWSGPSGWGAARVGQVSVFLRAGRYRSRPGHLDPLHLDVRFGGREVVADPGTYLYNGPPPWRNGLAGAEVHNGPRLDGAEPGVRGPRFLWYVWPSAELSSAQWEDGSAQLVGEITGRVRRTVWVGPSGVRVRDEALDGGAREMCVVWLVPMAGPLLLSSEPSGASGVAMEGEVRGWRSPHYGQRVPERWVEVRRALEEVRWIETLIGNASEQATPALDEERQHR